MKITPVGCTIVASLTVAMLAGCTGVGPQMQSFAPSAAQQAANGGHVLRPDASLVALTTREHIVPHVHLNLRKSWMNPDAKKTKYLLYVSDEAAGTVDV